MKRLALILALLAPLAYAGITVSPASVTTGLSWQSDYVPGNGGTSSYGPTNLVVSGATGNVTWTFADANGNDVTGQAAPGQPTTGTTGTTGSCTNTTCFVRISYSYNYQSSGSTDMGSAQFPQGETQWSPELTVATGVGLSPVINSPTNPNFAFGWNVAASTTTGKACQLNGAPIMFGTNFTITSLTSANCNGGPLSAINLPDFSTRFGSISNSSTSPALPCVNPCSSVFYYAPTMAPPSSTLTITAHDAGTGTSASVTVTYQFPFNLAAWWTHYARMLSLRNIPWGILQQVTAPAIYQPDLLFYNCQSVAYAKGTGRQEQTCSPVQEMAILRDNNSSDGPGFPTTAGSDINRPSWSYNGKWFVFGSSSCHTGFCSTGNGARFVLHSDGSASTLLAANSNNPVVTPSYNVTDWMFSLNSTRTALVTLNLAPLDSNTAITSTTLLTALPTPCAGCGTMSLFSQVLGSKLMVKPQNAGSCGGSAPCPNAGTWYTFDMGTCETNFLGSGNPGANCATQVGSFNLASFDGNAASVLNNSFDCTPTAHDRTGAGIGGEYRTHDSYMEPGSVGKNGIGKCVWNYGSFGNAGEAIFYEVNCFDGSGIVEKYPAFSSPGVPYQSHPAFGWMTNLVLYGGNGNQNTAVNGSACTQTGTNGGYLWNYSTNTNMGGDFIAALGAASGTFGHSGWDGFDSNYAVSDMHFNRADGFIHGADYDNLLPAHATLGRISFGGAESIDSGARGQNTNGGMYAGLYGPTQSPDGTKNGNTGNATNAAWEPFFGWFQRMRGPEPPAALFLVNNTGTLGFWPNSLNREVRRYWIYRQASCSGSWGDPITSITASYVNNFLPHTQYSFTDPSPLTAGQNACYGAASEEWDGYQGQLSNTIQVTNTAGVFSSTPKSAPGTVVYDSSAPANVSALAVTQKKLCQSTLDCSALDTPSTPTVANASGGTIPNPTSLTAKIVYCKFSDFPKNATAICTKASNASGSVSVVGGTLSIQGSSGDNTGHDAMQFYASSDGVNWWLQTCRGTAASGWVIPTAVTGTYLMPMDNNESGSADICLVDSFNNASSNPPVANTAVAGYKLAWTESAATDARYYQLYYSEGAAPILSQGENPAQTQLIATIPAGHGLQSNQYFDSLANLFPASTGIFYGVVTKDHAGNRSAGVCMRGDGTSVSCN